MTTPIRDVTRACATKSTTPGRCKIDDRTTGYSRIDTIGPEFVTSGEFRTLAASYAEISAIVRAMRKGPIEVRVSDGVKAAAKKPKRPKQAAEVTADEKDALGAIGVTPRRRRPRAGDGCQEWAGVRSRSIDEFIDHFIALGRKGVAINRYKGLGEMNPETLWTTTMNPDIRTLLQVRAEDHTEADSMFTTLMGDQVEPRRKFIEDNALEVKNLDI